MGRKCCVPNCCSNYDATIKRGVPAISTFKFPEDSSLLELWMHAIGRKDWIPTRRSSICIKHFAPDDIERPNKPAKLKQGAVPSLFGESLLSAFESNTNEHGRPSNIQAHHIDHRKADTTEWIKNDLAVKVNPASKEFTTDCINCFDDFREEAGHKLRNTSWMMLCRAEIVHLFLIDDTDDRSAIRIDRSIKVHRDLRVKLFLGENEQIGEQWDHILSDDDKLLRWSQLDCLVSRFGAASYPEMNCDTIGPLLREHSKERSKDVDYETVFLEEHLDEAENEYGLCDAKEATIETTVELRIEKQSPHAHDTYTDHVYNAAESTRQLDLCNLKQKSILSRVQELQSLTNNCFVCNLEHDTAEEFDQHMLTHLSLLPYQCQSCVHERVTVKTLATLNKHCMMHKKPLKCRFCDKRFTTYGSRRLHEDFKHSENGTSFKCGVCLKEFPSKRSFQYHRKVHDDPASLTCKICLRTLSSAYEVKLHMRTHTGEKPNKCTFCAACFNRKSNLTEHVRRCHSLELPFICEVCGGRFRSYLGFRRHMISHGVGQERPRQVTRLPKDFHCKECDRSFTTPIQYHSHKRQHVKRYQCSYCGIRIAQLRDFEDHQNTHTGSRPYACQICGKKFKTASTYYGHRLVHSKDKKHFCSVCNRGFLRLRHVQVHMRTHTGEKPFRCETCGRMYADKQTYSRHKLTHRPTVGDMIGQAKENLGHSPNIARGQQCQEAFVAPISEHGLRSEFVLSAVSNADVTVIPNNVISNDLDKERSEGINSLLQRSYVIDH